MTYTLGIDVGTTFTAAAVWRAGRAEAVELGDRTRIVPSVLFLRDDGEWLVGEVANRRALTDPVRVARQFKRRIGDEVPLLLGGTPVTPEALTGRMIRWVVDRVTEREGGPPAHVTLTCPASWTDYRRGLLAAAAAAAGLDDVGLLTEPVAAAVYYAAQERLDPGAVVGVYDLGGGTFDATVLRRTGAGFELVGRPGGDEQLGGVDFDQAIVDYVAKTLGDDWEQLDLAEPAVLSAVAQLRAQVVEAKEALSTDVATGIPVILPGVTKEVRLTRAELEEMIREPVLRTIEAFWQAVRAAGVQPGDLRGVLLVGGSSRIPLITELIASELGVPVTVDAHPKFAVCLGAAIAAAPRVAAAAMAAPVRDIPSVLPAAAVAADPATTGIIYPADILIHLERVAAPPAVEPAAAPGRVAGTAPERFADTPPRRVADAPPERFADTPPERFADTPPRRVADAPPERFADAPPGPVADAPPEPVAGAWVGAAPGAGAWTGPTGAPGRWKDVPDVPGTAPDVTRRPPRRARWLRVALALTVLATLVVAFTLTRGGGQDQPPTYTAARTADLPAALESPGVVSFQDKIWAIGGLGLIEGQSQPATSEVFVFDPAAGSWSAGPALPAPVSHVAAVTAGDDLYVVGGWDADLQAVRTVLRLDPAAQRWVEAAPLPEPRGAGAAAWDGTRTVFGGGTTAGLQAAEDDVWALQGDRWVPVGTLQAPREHLAAVGDTDGTVWFLGGRDDGGQDGERQLFGLVDEATADGVRPSGKRVTPSQGHAAVWWPGLGPCMVGGFGLAGATTGPDWIGTVECLDGDQGVTLPELAKPRTGIGAAVVGDDIYVVGGFGAGDQGSSTVSEVFRAEPA